MVLTSWRVRSLRWKVPLYPFTPVACIMAVLVAIIGPIFQNSPGPFGINSGALPVIAGAIWTVLWALYYLAIGRNFKHGAEYYASGIETEYVPFAEVVE